VSTSWCINTVVLCVSFNRKHFFIGKPYEVYHWCWITAQQLTTSVESCQLFDSVNDCPLAFFKDLSRRSFLVIVLTEPKDMPVRRAICRCELWVPDCSSWLSVRPSTSLTMAGVHALHALADRSILPVLPIFLSRLFTSFSFHCLSGNILHKPVAP